MCKQNHTQTQKQQPSPATTSAPSTFQWSYRGIEHYNIKSRSQKHFNTKSSAIDNTVYDWKNNQQKLRSELTKGDNRSKNYDNIKDNCISNIVTDKSSGGDLKTNSFDDNKNNASGSVVVVDEDTITSSCGGGDGGGSQQKDISKG